MEIFILIYKDVHHTNQYIIKSNHDFEEKNLRLKKTQFQIYKVKMQ